MKRNDALTSTFAVLLAQITSQRKSENSEMVRTLNSSKF